VLLTHEFVPAAELTGFARAALADLPTNQFRLKTFLPDLAVDDLQYRFNRGGGGLTRAATYRAWDTEAGITSREGITPVSGDLPPISRKIPVMEYAALKQRRQEQRITNLILRDTQRIVRETAARVEIARASALVNGRVDLPELKMSVDFGRSKAMAPKADVLWSEVGATPLSDLIAWMREYRKRNGIAPSVIVTSMRVVGVLMTNEEIRGAVYGAAVANSPSYVSQAQLDTVLNAHGLPSISVYDAQVELDAGATSVLPDTHLLMLPGDGVHLGNTQWGTTLESLSADYQIEDGEEPGIVVGTYSTQDPVHLWTRSNAVSLPVLGSPNMAFAATVLPKA
jgi:hypothetical protein